MNRRSRSAGRRPGPSLIVHGGAWNIPDTLVDAYRSGVMRALKEGWAVLRKGGSAVAAVECAIAAMENDETFNAGRGSVLNAAGEIELDAGIMAGKGLRAGAVAAVQNVANPISLARLVMERSEHVLLVGMGATRFARDHRVKTCREDDLITEREIENWRRLNLSHRKNRVNEIFAGKSRLFSDTVGAVALDASGSLAAGTSTGGTPNKHPGRVGDAPLIGCGAYADDEIGAASSTGWGEALIKVVLAKRVLDIMTENGGEAEQAAKDGIAMLRRKVKGYGGVIALNTQGNIGIAYNTPRMARAYMTSAMKSPEAAV
jgi:beta-aspartyl-peptidase (threonine type)